ncbi:MAG: polysaccharide biosynthesis/export family protein [Novosphingobium sp.]
MNKRRFKNLVLVFASTALSGGLSGCATTPEPITGPVTASPVAEYGQSDFSPTLPAQYLLRPGDIVTITVFREPDMSMENVPVSAEGMISVPLAGMIKAEGLTAAQLEEAVTLALQDRILKHPRVSVNVMKYGSHLVTVEGAVEKAGMYSFEPGTRLSGTIALASGPSRVAKLTQVAVFRQTPDGMTVAKFDYAAVRQGTMIDPVMEPGDRVVVGLSGLSQFWQDLIKSLPAFALFTRL